MITESAEVIAAGHLCLDLFPRFNNEPGRSIVDLLRPGTLVRVGGMAFATGGSVSNTGIALKKFGCRVGFVAKVGDDAIGSILVDILRREGNAAGISVARGESTSYSVVVAPVGIDRIFLHCPGANDTFGCRDIDFGLVGQARLFHLGYPTLMDGLFAHGGQELAAIFAQAKGRGVTTSMDISLPDPGSPAGKADWRAICRRSLPSVDIFLPSIEEAFFTLHPAEYLERKRSHPGEDLIGYIEPGEFSSIAAEYIDMGCAMVALKAGHLGWYIRTAGRDRLKGVGRAAPDDVGAWSDRELWCPPFRTEAIAGSTGAGDSSIAGFLAALLRGRPIGDCLKIANCAGYMNLRAVDALSGLGSWDELEALWPALDTVDVPALRGTAWRWDPQRRLWSKGK